MVAPIFAVPVVAPMFVVPVVAPMFVAPRLRLGLVALCRVSKGIKSIGEIPDAAYSPSNKLST